MLKFPRNPIKYNKKLILVTAVDTTNNITLDTMVFNSINDAEQYILDAKDAYYNKDINIAFVIAETSTPATNASGIPCVPITPNITPYKASVIIPFAAA